MHPRDATPQDTFHAAEPGADAPAAGAWQPCVLVADAAPAMRAGLAAAIRSAEPDARIVEATTGRQIFTAIETEQPTFAFVGLHYEDVSGPDALGWARARGGPMPSLVLTAGQVVSRWIEVSQRLDAYEFVRLPLDPSDIAHLMAAHRRQRAPLRALVAEASAQGRQLVRRVLARSGFALDVEETDDGRHALKMLRLQTFDVVLIDLGLPGLNGLEVACQARGLAPDAKLFLMTGGDVDELARAGRHFGLDFVLRKPFAARDVDAALHHGFGLRRPYLLNALIAENPARTLAVVEAPDAASARVAAAT